jgi:ubiquinone/menaquinone biosynthesis C-methylase UbiE
MQRTYYDNEGVTGNMNRENHMGHNKNPDYWNILVKDTEDPVFLNKVGLDFGCGCGRNVINLYKRFQRMDGVDISPELVATCNSNLAQYTDDTRYKFYVCNGISLDVIGDGVYDFVMSTIVLQHICVHDIRYSYLKEFYRVMKSGGILSIQLGFGNCPSHFRDYYDNFYEATGTNSGCDVRISDPNHIVNELKEIGFKNITCIIRPAWDGPHDEWLFVRADKE